MTTILSYSLETLLVLVTLKFQVRRTLIDVVEKVVWVMFGSNDLRYYCPWWPLIPLVM